MIAGLRSLIVVLLLVLSVQAEVAPVSVRVPNATGWIGQRVPFYVDLRARGTFEGTASFDLPQVPGAMVMKIGEPLVETDEFEGEKWFVQRHEFALFSQKSGPVELPAFTVRFSRRDGYSGAASDVQEQAAGLSFEIRRPPVSESIGFLITTESLDINEMWEPTPGPANVGDVFKRTIVQRAPQMTGMALAPTSTTAPDGIRVYSGGAETSDNFYRGAFQGERRETLTYLVKKPGTLELPALMYVWWNPKTEKLQSKTLPAVIFEVTPPVAVSTAENPGLFREFWPHVLGMVLTIGLLAWQKRRIAAWGMRCWKTLHTPERVASRRLLRACRRHDAAASEAAWSAWCKTQDPAVASEAGLRAAVTGLHRERFGSAPTGHWHGGELARAFAANLAIQRSHTSIVQASVLPALNPSSVRTEDSRHT